MDAAKENNRSSRDQRNLSTPLVAASSLHDPTTASRVRNIPEFSDLVFACRHHLLRTLVVGSVFSAVLVCAAWSWTEPLYRAESLVRVREQQDVVFAAQASRTTDATFFHSQAKLVLSPPVLAAALNDKNIRALAHDIPAQDAVEWLKPFLKVDMQSGSEVMSISASHTSPRVAQAMSSAVTQAYLTEVSNRLAFDREQREKKLELAARDADHKLDVLWAELNTVVQSIGSDSSQSLTIRDELQFQAYRDYAKQLQTAQLRSSELTRQLAEQELSRDAARDGETHTAESLLQQNPDVVSARERLQDLELQIKQMQRIAARDDSPRLIRLSEDRDACAAELSRLLDELGPALRERSRQQSRHDRQTAVTKVQKQIESNQAEIDFLQSRLSEIDTGVSRNKNNGGVQLDIYRHAVDRQTRLADSLWQSLQELRIERQSQPRVTLMELPEVPEQANRSRQFKAASAAGIAGWMIAILGIGYCEWQDCRVRSVHDVTTHSLFPVFGSGWVSRGSGLGRLWPHAISGAREAAARMMLLDQNNRVIPTLMVSSATASEPRHFASLDLAQAFCKFNRRTILIDCDTHSNALGKTLGAQEQQGLLQCGPSASDIRRHIIPTDQDGLDFLPVGPHDKHDAWVDPQTLKTAIDTLRHDYQAIIVNGPAVLRSAESLLLAAQVDLLLFSVFLGTSRWSHLALGEQSAIQSGISVGGCVLQHGRRATRLALLLDRRGEASRFSTEHAAAAGLRDQLNEIQNDLRQAQASTAAGKANRSRQESSHE